MNWYAMDTPGLNGALNMALDQFFLKKIEDGDAKFYLRFYDWQPYCISLGHSQKPEKEIDIEFVRSQNLGLVRRMTGGRVVFHAQELTYSVVGPLHLEDWTASLALTYERINLALQKGLQELGFAVQLERGDLKQGFEKDTVQKPCFASTSKSELVYEGKKVVGSAQRRLRNGFIQHGSLLLGAEHLEVGRYLNGVDEEVYRKFVAENSIALSEMGQVPVRSELCKGLLNGFVKEFGNVFNTKEITKLEFSEAEKLKTHFDLL